MMSGVRWRPWFASKFARGRRLADRGKAVRAAVASQPGQSRRRVGGELGGWDQEQRTEGRRASGWEAARI